MFAAIVVAVLAGLAVGLALGAARSARETTELPADPPSARLGTEPVGDGPDLDEIAYALRDAVNHLEIGVVVSGSDGSIVFRNRAAGAMLGTHVGVIVDEQVERLLALARSGERTENVVDLRGPPAISVEIIAAPVAGGGAVATVHDVSERVRIDTMRTDFVANVSHELRTPVGAIAVLAETLVDEARAVDAADAREVAEHDHWCADRDGVVSRLAGRMADESRRAVHTLDDLLQLSRIESAVPSADVVDLGELLDTAVARGRDADPSGRVDFTAFPTDSPLLVRGDGRQLASALGNLVENAVKYSPEGGVVQLRARADERHVEVMVVDEGIGIPQRDLDRIFERFYRVDKGRSRDTGGTGLGLAIVRHVAGNHGGDVQVFSREGEGSTFVLRLPARLVVTADAVEEPERS